MTSAHDNTHSQIDAHIRNHRALDDRQRDLTSESRVVHQFIDPLVKALGWPIEHPIRYRYELHTSAVRPFALERGEPSRIVGRPGA